MERLRKAIQKAREGREPGYGPTGAYAGTATATTAKPARAMVEEAWNSLEQFKPQQDLMAKNRIVTFDRHDNAHIPYDMMRTRVLSVCRQNNWKVVGVTSPSPSCGKTVTAINLAFSLARQQDARTLLVDADLRLPMIANSLGIKNNHSVGRFFSGGADVSEHFLSYQGNLAIGTNSRRSLNSAEILQDHKATDAMNLLQKTLEPDLVIVDMPPMKVVADVMAFLPNVDAMLLVAAAGSSRLRDVDECERELAEHTNFMGVVLNKCRYTSDSHNYKYY